MSGNKGLNCNQNHCLKNHNSTKVLQPPGGASSFSIGGFGGGAEAPRPRKQVPRAAAPEPSYNRPPVQQYNRQQAAPVGYNSYGRPRSNSEDVGADALDNVMESRKGCGIPGLENHYGGREQAAPRANMNDSYGSEPFNARGVQGSMSKAEYANSLRAQIDNKRTLNRGNTDNYSAPKNTNDAQYGSGNVSFSNSSNVRGAPARMSSNEYADALKAQINEKRRNFDNGGVTASIGSRAPQRKENYGYNDEAKENHYQERSQGSIRVRNAPGGNSSFQLY